MSGERCSLLKSVCRTVLLCCFKFGCCPTIRAAYVTGSAPRRRSIKMSSTGTRINTSTATSIHIRLLCSNDWSNVGLTVSNMAAAWENVLSCCARSSRISARCWPSLRKPSGSATRMVSSLFPSGGIRTIIFSSCCFWLSLPAIKETLCNCISTGSAASLITVNGSSTVLPEISIRSGKIMCGIGNAVSLNSIPPSSGKRLGSIPRFSVKVCETSVYSFTVVCPAESVSALESCVPSDAATFSPVCPAAVTEFSEVSLLFWPYRALPVSEFRPFADVGVSFCPVPAFVVWVLLPVVWPLALAVALFCASLPVLLPADTREEVAVVSTPDRSSEPVASMRPS